MKLLLPILLLALSGCASIMSKDTAHVYIGAYDETGDPVKANCLVTSDEGVYRTRSNRNIKMGKDKDEISVECHNDEYTGQTVNDEAGVNFGYWAVDFFLLDLCIISCFVDGLSGSWVTMPTHITVNMDAREVEVPLKAPANNSWKQN